jgi:cytochrome c peroxidase
MEWCLNCHRDPAQFVRPRQDVFVADSSYPVQNTTAALLNQGHQLVVDYHIPTDGRLTNCATCHR